MIRIGSVPYLNGKPLVYKLDENPDVELIQEVPSRLAILLKEGIIAAGLVSSAACFMNHKLQIVPGICISSNGPAESVKLLYNGELSDIKKVALDTSSITSVTLAKVILSERYNLNPEFVSMPPVVPAMLHACDAAVVIGDPAMQIPRGRWTEIDLGDEWHKLTGLPFVFAAWAVNPDMADRKLTGILQAVKALGLQSLDDISSTESKRLNLPVDVCYRYLDVIMDYDLTEEHLKALRLFRQKVIELGIIPNAHMPELFQPAD